MASRLRTAIVADYLNQRGGAEWVVGVLHELYPDAPIFTTIVDRSNLWPALRDADIRPSWMQRLPGLRNAFRRYLPLYYLAVEGLDLREYDLVISNSCAFALGARARPGARHICYCHTPARFIWDYRRYVAKEAFGPLTRVTLPIVISLLKRWDLAWSRRPQDIIGNSRAVAARIERCYGRKASVIHPPVDVNRFRGGAAGQDHYLVVSRLAAYKRIDLVVEAFNKLGAPLLVVGDGPQRARLESMARPNVRFVGWQSDAVVADAYRRCRALIFPGEEDFGITVVEAAAAGRPTVAYRAGGALDTVVEGVTGEFFDEPDADQLADAVTRLERARWNEGAIRAHAEQFGIAAFGRRFRSFVEARTLSMEGLGVAS